MTTTPEHETAAEVAEFLGLTYVPGMGAFGPDGELVYMDDTLYLMPEDQEKRALKYRQQEGDYPERYLTREGIRSGSKLMWRDAGTKIMRVAFFGNRRVMDLHLPRAVDDVQSLTLCEWKEARRDMERDLAQLSGNT